MTLVLTMFRNYWISAPHTQVVGKSGKQRSESLKAIFKYAHVIGFAAFCSETRVKIKTELSMITKELEKENN